LIENNLAKGEKASFLARIRERIGAHQVQKEKRKREKSYIP